MGSKINLNISNEWEPKVRPILEKWKKEEGNFSDKVCEAIAFLETATNEKIYEAIMHYDAKLEYDKLKKEARMKEQEILEIALGHLVDIGSKNAYAYLTEAGSGPRLNIHEASKMMKKLHHIVDNDEYVLDKTKKSGYTIGPCNHSASG